jgi:hypothetical protein
VTYQQIIKEQVTETLLQLLEKPKRETLKLALPMLTENLFLQKILMPAPIRVQVHAQLLPLLSEIPIQGSESVVGQEGD